MRNRRLYRSVPLSISAPSKLLLERVNESRVSKAAAARAVDAPPESSDESDGEDSIGRKDQDDGKGKTDKGDDIDDISDVSDDEPRGSIQASTFSSNSRNGKTTNRPSTQVTPSTARSQSKRPGLLVSLRSREDSPASTRGTKRGRDEESRPATKKVDLSATSIEFGGRTKPRQGYGRSLGSQGSQGSQGQSSQRAAFKPPPAELAELAETDDVPRKSKRPEPTAKFKKSKYADSDDEGSTSTVTSTTASRSTSTSTSKAKAAKASFKKSKYASSDDERDRDEKDGKEDGKEKKRSGDKKVKAETKETRETKEKKEKKEKKSFMKSNIYGQRKKDNEPKGQPKEAAPRAVFKMPEFNAASIGPDVALDDDLLQSLSQSKAVIDEPPPQPVCPLCKTVVDIETIEALLPGHYLLKNKAKGVKLSQLKFDEKVMFCGGHKQRASRQVWTARGYPSIDWALLPARLDTHFAHIKKVLILKESTYRTEYERQTTKTMDAAVPGYYGRRGQQVLAAAILQHAQLSAVLRQQAVEDTVVSARGMVSYVQAVLVPELAVQLIREDMGGAGKVSAAAGRQILAESAAIGEQVMEEERDVVAEESEDESLGSDYGGQYSD